jgi:copper chaperone
MQKIYRVEGMTCCGCASAVEQAIKNAAPGAEVKANSVADEVTVTGVDDDALVQTAVEDAGFDFGGVV